MVIHLHFSVYPRQQPAQGRRLAYGGQFLCHSVNIRNQFCLFLFIKADADIGVPDSGVSAALGFSSASGIPFSLGLIKNKYIGRSFILSEQKERESIVNLKLNAIKTDIDGKRIVVIDDSLVRGTTCKYLIRLLRRAGAKEIHLRISSPQVVFPCYLGIDTPQKDELISTKSSPSSIAICNAWAVGITPKFWPVELITWTDFAKIRPFMRGPVSRRLSRFIDGLIVRSFCTFVQLLSIYLYFSTNFALFAMHSMHHVSPPVLTLNNLDEKSAWPLHHLVTQPSYHVRVAM